jgi:hypothetical protein
MPPGGVRAHDINVHIGYGCAGLISRPPESAVDNICNFIET